MAPKPSATTASATRPTLSTFTTAERLLDLAERIAVLLLFAVFVHHLLPRLVSLVRVELAHPELLTMAAGINAQALLLIVSEGLGVLLIVARRRSPSLSTHPFDWLLSFSAVSAPLLLTVPTPPGTLIPAFVATGVMLAGLLLQIAAKLALWRSFGLVPANRGVKTRGPYRLLRHPMYAGYTLTHIGFLIGFPSWRNALLYAAVLAVEIGRLLREEAVLRRDPAYLAYATRVRARLLPGVF
jgi:protein-S-isoprenylcysteine O-methyltransferase Ste14